jgi:hypothetical protein
MHTKETVWYLCHEFVLNGVKFYYKREMLTTDTHRQPKSVYWSRPKPISKWTFEKAQKNGYKCLIIKDNYLSEDIQKTSYTHVLGNGHAHKRSNHIM